MAAGSPRSHARARYAAVAILVSILSLNAFAGLAAGHISSPAHLATVRGTVQIHENFGGQDYCVTGDHGDDTAIDIYDAFGRHVLRRTKGDGGPFTLNWATLAQVPNGHYRVYSWGIDIHTSFLGCSASGLRFLGSIDMILENRAFLVEAMAAPAFAGEPVAVQVRLTLEQGHPAVGGRPVKFCPDWAGCIPASTDGSGVARAQLPSVAAAGSRTVTVQYDGDAYFKGTSTVLGVNVQPRPTAISYVGDTTGMKGSRSQFAAVLVDATPGSASQGAAIASKDVTFTIGEFYTGAPTDETGRAEATSRIYENPGTHAITAHFAGDAAYAPATVTADFEVVWPHTFVDDGGMGTVHVNPTTHEFQLITPETDSGIVTDLMMVVLWTPREPACEDPIDCLNPLAESCFDGVAESCRPGLVEIGHVGETFTLAGVFHLDSGRFAALATSPSPFLLASTGDVEG